MLRSYATRCATSILVCFLTVGLNVQQDESLIGLMCVHTRACVFCICLQIGCAIQWHVGMATTAQTPKGRSFMSSLGYFHSFNDYFNEQRPTHRFDDLVALPSRPSVAE